MADSCRPASRHGGRYSANHDHADVQYSDNLPSYSTVEYRNVDEMYRQNHSPVLMERTMERPRTGRGYRQIRPQSRGGREEIFDETKTGRPTSRVGFRPDTYDRHDYDEFSRQEPRVVSDSSDSENSSPGGGNNSPIGNSPSQKMSPSQMSVSPAEGYLSAQSPSAFRLLSRETVSQRSPLGSPYQTQTNQMSPLSSPPYHGETGLQKSPLGSPYHSHRSPRRQQQPDYANEEQVFDFDGNSYDKRYENPLSYTGNEQYQYTDTHPQDSQSYGDYGVSSENPPDGYAPILSGKNRYKYGHYQNVDNSDTYQSDVMPVHEEPQTPRPPSSRPRSSRPKSARKRPQSGRKRQEEQYVNDDAYSQAADSTMVRPHSSFLRYKPLPAIGANETMSNQERADELAEQTKQLHLHEQQRSGSAASKGSGSFTQQPFSSAKDILNSGPNNLQNTSDQEDSGANEDQEQQSSFQHFRPHRLSDEPGDNEERLLLAVKLPDGKRVQRHFRIAEKLESVKQYAENVLCSDLSQYTLSCNAPKAVFTDLSQLIGEVGLQDRTLLLLIER
ncbi:uncharacterized protein [Mytilus edulis]|uniref:uncharacterized protein n=1 Tax=Mytilus edulis TaxID=6550 RepID=UPI0039EDEECA